MDEAFAKTVKRGLQLVDEYELSGDEAVLEDIATVSPVLVRYDLWGSPSGLKTKGVAEYRKLQARGLEKPADCETVENEIVPEAEQVFTGKAGQSQVPSVNATATAAVTEIVDLVQQLDCTDASVDIALVRDQLR